MTEELTVSVREEVVVFLNSALAAIEGPTGMASLVLGRDDVQEFYDKVKSEIRGIIQDYADVGKKVESAPAEVPVKIGDRVRVLPDCGSAPAGLEFKVKRVTRNKSPYDDGVNWYVEGTKKGSTNGVWGKFIELIEPKSDASKIEVGDLVRLTGDLWDSDTPNGYHVVAGANDEGLFIVDADGDYWYLDESGWGAVLYKKASEL